MRHKPSIKLADPTAPEHNDVWSKTAYIDSNKKVWREVEREEGTREFEQIAAFVGTVTIFLDDPMAYPVRMLSCKDFDDYLYKGKNI